MEKQGARAGGRRKLFLTGLSEGIPIGLGYFAVAFSLGIAARGSGLTAVQGFLEIIEPFMSKILVDSIHDGDFVVFNYVRVVSHSVRDVILAFKKIDFVVVDADVENITGDFHRNTS